MEESRIKHRGVVSAELSEFCAKATYQLQITILAAPALLAPTLLVPLDPAIPYLPALHGSQVPTVTLRQHDAETLVPRVEQLGMLAYRASLSCSNMFLELPSLHALHYLFSSSLCPIS